MWDVSTQSVATEFPKVYKGQVCIKKRGMGREENIPENTERNREVRGEKQVAEVGYIH